MAKGKQRDAAMAVKDVLDKIEGGAYGRDDDLDESSLLEDLHDVIDDL